MNSKTALQYTIFLEHKSGAMEKIVSRLKSENIQIIALSGSGSVDGGLLRIVIEKETDHVNSIFKSMNVFPMTAPVIVLRIDKKSPTDLNYILQLLASNDINLQSVNWSDCSENSFICVSMIPDKFDLTMKIIEEI
ncbi:hypothetical protein JW890_04545 [candidate division WOR-3 bacterium]|nr:hypothetical protein [candidate division WOR-3 bacterium]